MPTFLSVPGSQLSEADSKVYCQSFEIASAAMRTAILLNFPRKLVMVSADGKTIYGHHIPFPSLRLVCDGDGYLVNGQLLSRAIGCDATRHLQPVIKQVLATRYDRSLVYAIAGPESLENFHAGVMHYAEDTVLIIIRRSAAFSISEPLHPGVQPSS